MVGLIRGASRIKSAHHETRPVTLILLLFFLLLARVQYLINILIVLLEILLQLLHSLTLIFFFINLRCNFPLLYFRLIFVRNEYFNIIDAFEFLDLLITVFTVLAAGRIGLHVAPAGTIILLCIGLKWVHSILTSHDRLTLLHLLNSGILVGRKIILG